MVEIPVNMIVTVTIPGPIGQSTMLEFKFGSVM